MQQTYKSKVDTWLAVVIVIAIVACLFTFAGTLRSGNMALILTTLPALLVGAGLPLWLMLGTNYTLKDTTLLVKSGPFRWRVPIRDITSVTPTHNPLSSPALSLDRLRMEYGKGESIMISPKRKSEFIRDLEARRIQSDSQPKII